MIASLFLSLREGLEAALLIGVMLGALRKFNRSALSIWIWLGTVTALVLSLIAGVSLNLIGATFEGRGEAIFEGTTMLLAAGVLTWVIIWMGKQARISNQKLETDIQYAITHKNGTPLFILAFVAVIREGVELAFFLTAAALNADRSQVILGAGLGIAAAALISLLLFRSLLRLNLSAFFRATSVILILFAAGLFAHGIHEFNEAGLIPPVIPQVWNINHILDEKSPLGELLKSLFGYNGNPSLTELLGYLVYFVVFGLLYPIIGRDPSKLIDPKRQSPVSSQ
jgi:high-affinity iron transporter